MSAVVTGLMAREVLDCRGLPTVQVDLALEDGTVATADVPARRSRLLFIRPAAAWSASWYPAGADSRPARAAAAASIGNRPGSAPKRRKASCSSGLSS